MRGVKTQRRDIEEKDGPVDYENMNHPEHLFRTYSAGLEGTHSLSVIC